MNSARLDPCAFAGRRLPLWVLRLACWGTGAAVGYALAALTGGAP